MSAYGYT
ncbi:hypothetical protein EYF80_067712 [Liparis tanakae]|nr:hypothetical protein EYF80_067712 [Liparis tanakae]